MARKAKIIPMLDDLPAREDALGFVPYRDAIAGVISDPNTSTPLTIGIFGTWGAGKTSLMTMIRDLLPEEGFLTIWFDAWKYEKEASLWRALLLRVLDALRPGEEELKDEAARKLREELGRLEEALYRDVEWEERGGLTIDLSKVLGGAAGLTVKLALATLPGFVAEVVEAARKGLGGAEEVAQLAEAIRREAITHHQAQLRYIEQFRQKFEALVKEHIVEKGKRLVVFVDDLDRCLPEKAVEVLEAIKLFLDAPGCVFLLGLDEKVIARGIKVKYRDFLVAEGAEGRREIPIDGVKYLEKIIQLPFLLPPIEPEDMEGFVEKLVPEFPDARCTEVFAKGLREPNPRQVKRLINLFLFLWRVAQAKEELRDIIKPVRLAKVVVIQHSHPDLYEVLREQPGLLAELERYFQETSRVGERAIPTEEGAEERPEVHPRLEPFIGLASLRRLLTLHPAEGPGSEDTSFLGLKPDDIRPYFTLAHRTAPEVIRPERVRTVEPQTVLIPEGEFIMGSEEGEDEKPLHKVHLPTYRIGKYPVTNVEYQAFIRDTGHRPPRHWEDDKYPEGRGDHPVVNVSWHDATAYCQWLREKTGKEYRLPTEAEWEKAASWDPEAGRKRRYPWGDEFDKGKCNTEESGIGDTTPVRKYSPEGDSAYGVADMAGNVWEWCNSLYRDYPYNPDDGRESPKALGRRVLRGGSWLDNRDGARCAFRDRDIPDGWSGDLGFRVVAPASF